MTWTASESATSASESATSAYTRCAPFRWLTLYYRGMPRRSAVTSPARSHASKINIDFRPAGCSSTCCFCPGLNSYASRRLAELCYSGFAAAMGLAACLLVVSPPASEAHYQEHCLEKAYDCRRAPTSCYIYLPRRSDLSTSIVKYCVSTQQCLCYSPVSQRANMSSSFLCLTASAYNDSMRLGAGFNSYTQTICQVKINPHIGYAVLTSPGQSREHQQQAYRDCGEYLSGMGTRNIFHLFHIADAVRMLLIAQNSSTGYPTS
jgi:hypothetical protein